MAQLKSICSSSEKIKNLVTNNNRLHKILTGRSLLEKTRSEKKPSLVFFIVDLNKKTKWIFCWSDLFRTVQSISCMLSMLLYSIRAINCIFCSGLSPPKTYLEWSNVPNIITIPFFFSSMYAYKVFMCMWYILCGKPKPPGAELFLLEPGLNFKRLAPAPSVETNFVDEVETIFENTWAYE